MLHVYNLQRDDLLKCPKFEIRVSFQFLLHLKKKVVKFSGYDNAYIINSFVFYQARQLCY